MSSTFSTNLALELIGTGDQAGSWGNTTNTNLGTLIEQAISGYVTQAVATGTDTTITIPNGATGVARNMYIELTGTGGTNTNLIVPANKKLYFIYNNASGAVTVKVSGQTGVSVPAGEKQILVSNGTDIVAATSYITAVGSSLNLTTLTATSANITTLTGTTISATNMGAQATTQFQAASANITTATGTTFSATTMGAQSTTTFLGTSANITTLSGTNFSATSLTLTNALAVASGGSGRASTTAYAVICGGTTSTGPQQSIASVGTSGQVLTSNGAGALPTFQTAAGLPTMNIVTGTTQAAVTANQYVLTNVAATTVTLPASPAAGATVYVTVANGLTTNVVARNGSNIQSLAEDMTLNAAYAAVQLRYADATRGWVLT